MHLNSTIGKGLTQLSVLGTELNFDPRREFNTMLCQVFINLPLAMARGDLRIEVHVDPNTMRRSFPLLLRRSFSFACASDRADFPAFVISTKVKRAIETRKPETLNTREI